MKRLFLTAALVLTLAVSNILAAAPKREFRSVWIAAMGIDFPYKSASRGTSAAAIASAKGELTAYLDSYERMGLTGVCFHVRPNADAYYKSSYEPWSASLTGTRGKDPGWDPLAFMVEECHKRGIECYAWVNPFRIAAKAPTTSLNTAFDKEWDSMDGWIIYSKDGQWKAFNPANPDAMRHCLDVIKEIYTNYGVDGLLFDDYFYPGPGMAEDSSADDYADYEASEGGKEAGKRLSMADWRRQNVNNFVKTLYEEIQAARPDMRFGISPAGVAGASGDKYGVGRPAISSSDYMYSKIYCDPLAWLHDGTIDFISPQIYWQQTHATAPFEPLTRWYDGVCKKFNRHLYVAAGSYRLGEDSSSSTYIGGNTERGWKELAAQVEITRKHSENGSCGMIWYSAKWIDGPYTSGLGDYLIKNTYTAPALVPAVTWKGAKAYAAPASASLSNGRLSWTATKGAAANSIIRYTVYAVPTTLTVEKAMGTDGIKGEYLLGVTYSPSYSLPANVTDTSKYWYAVCVYDGYGLESAPALVNYPEKDSQAPALIAPADGAELGDEAEFSWSAVPDAQYALELSLDKDFSQVFYEVSALTATSHKVNLKEQKLTSRAQCWWRVTAAQPKSRPAESEARTFTAPERSAADYEEGYSVVKDPASYSSDGDISIENLWTRSVAEPYENFTAESNGSFNRGMTATEKCVYVSGRSANAADADIYLRVYDAESGAHMHDIKLDTKGRCAFYPCNDVMTDNAGNIIIANLTSNSSASPVRLFKVNVADGSLTDLGNFVATGRVDHVGIYGDVDSDLWYVFAGVAGSRRVLRWTVENGRPTEGVSYDFKEYYPAQSGRATGLGTAPRIHPVSPVKFYVDGANTAFTPYELTETGAVMLGSLGKSSDAYVTSPDYTDNGGAVFTVGNAQFMAYSSASPSLSVKWNIALMGKEDLSDLKYLWTVPAAGLGTVKSGTAGAPVATVPMGEGVTNVYFYSPGNGLAAYAVRNANASADDIIAPDTDAPAEYYTLQGVRVSASSLTPGIYICRRGTTVTKTLVR